MSDEQRRVNLEIDDQILSDMEVTIRLVNDGKLKGRKSPAFEYAAAMYTVAAFAKNPDIMTNMGDLDDSHQPEDLEEYRDRIQNYADEMSDFFQEVALRLDRDAPGEPTELSERLDIYDLSEGYLSEEEERPDHIPEDFYSLFDR